MPFTATPLPGVIIFEPAVYPDERGFFFESYNQRLFHANQITNEFVQDNQSFSAYGVIRGLHFQRQPHAQSKLVRVLQVNPWMWLWICGQVPPALANPTALNYRLKIKNRFSFRKDLHTAFRY